MTRLIGVYGAGGCGRGIMPLVRAQYAEDCCVFIDDVRPEAAVNGHDRMGWDEFLARDALPKAVSLAIAAPAVRQRLAGRCADAGVSLIEARAATVVEMDQVSIGEGACLSPFVTLTSNIAIGRCFHANLYAYVEHDCLIGDFVTLSPSAKVNGSVRVGDNVFVGAGAVIRQGLTIGSGAVIGMGAVVTRDVPPGATVVGNPAEPLARD